MRMSRTTLDIDAALLEKLRGWQPQATAVEAEAAGASSAAAGWRAASKDLRTDERLPTS